MSSSDAQSPTPVRDASEWAIRGALLRRLAIWSLFLALVYLVSHFFFVTFMTFMFSYLTINAVGLAMRWLSPHRDRLWLRRLLTIVLFLMVPVALFVLARLVVVPLVSQGQRIVGWVSQLDLQTELTRLLEPVVGPLEFRGAYGGPTDPRYQKAFAEFRRKGPRHVVEYYDFPSLEAWVEGSFNQLFSEEQRYRIRRQLREENTSSRDFEKWFVAVKLPEMKRYREQHIHDPDPPADPVLAALERVPFDRADLVLEQIRQNPAVLARLREEWVEDSLKRELAAAKQSPAYATQFREYFDVERGRLPDALPYTYDQYIKLKKARAEGPEAFGKVLNSFRSPKEGGESEASLQADFEAAKMHELFQDWWTHSSGAQFIQHHLEERLSAAGGAGAAWLERLVASLINVPIDLATALLLSFFICIDFSTLNAGVRRVRDTWLRNAYDEITPALVRLAHLIGRAMFAQGLIAVCNATMMFIALSLIGVEHAGLLSLTVFILCLVPVVGMILSWVPILLMALVQPGGGMFLALKATGAIVFVLFMENFVFSPRIFGKMMELHPVLIIAILPVAQYFFGVWGVILATPVTVYIIHEVILRPHLVSEAPDAVPLQPQPSP